LTLSRTLDIIQTIYVDLKFSDLKSTTPQIKRKAPIYKSWGFSVSGSGMLYDISEVMPYAMS